MSCPQHVGCGRIERVCDLLKYGIEIVSYIVTETGPLTQRPGENQRKMRKKKSNHMICGNTNSMISNHLHWPHSPPPSPVNLKTITSLPILLVTAIALAPPIPPPQHPLPPTHDIWHLGIMTYNSTHCKHTITRQVKRRCSSHW